MSCIGSTETDVENPSDSSISVTRWWGKIPKPISWMLLVCLIPVAYACVTAATVIVLSASLIPFVLLQLHRFTIQGEFLLSHFIRNFYVNVFISMFAMLLLVEGGIFYPFAKFLTLSNVMMIAGFPILRWIQLSFLLIGVYLLYFVILFGLAVMPYKMEMDKEEFLRGIIFVAIPEIIGCLLFWVGEVVVMLIFPSLKKAKIYEIYTHKWIELLLFLLIGYNIIQSFTYVVVWSLSKFYDNPSQIGKQIRNRILSAFTIDHSKTAPSKSYLSYVAHGSKDCIISLLNIGMLLLTWLLYLAEPLSKTTQSKTLVKYGTWSLISILICSVLWLIKSCILLYWKTHTIYNRLHSKIEEIGKLLYFLVLLSAPQFKNNWTEEDCVLLEKYESEDGVPDLYFPREVVWNELIHRIGPNASILDIQQAAKIFLTAQYLLSTGAILHDLHHLQSPDTEDDNAFVIETLKMMVECGNHSKDDWDMLLDLLPNVQTAKDITFEKVKTWMERAHNRCVFLANTLVGENEVVKCLDHLMSCLIIGVTFIVWLLITGFATVQVFVLIASPLLAVTFIFGDTCKSFFQGLIFIYVVHLFSVGDLCLLDGNLMEVKKIGVWSTTFTKVRTLGKQEEVVYPNSELAAKNIINHKTEFNWNDCIEFGLSSPDEEATNSLIQEIENYLRNEKERFDSKFHSVELMEIGETVKIVVHIKHNAEAKTKGWTNFECLKEKDKRRLKFALYLQKLVHRHTLKKETPELYPMAL